MRKVEGCVINEFEKTITEHNGLVSLIHQVNCQGVMGSGVAKQIRSKYPNHYEDYTNTRQVLGNICVTDLDFGGKLGTVFGVFGQEEYGRAGTRYTNYAGLFQGLIKVADYFRDKPGRKHLILIPMYIGCGLGGGNWSFVESFLVDLEEMYNIEFVVVEYNG